MSGKLFLGTVLSAGLALPALPALAVSVHIEPPMRSERPVTKVQACGWFIVLRCGRSQRAARSFLDRLGGPGVGGGAGTRVIDTNQYPNFRNGFYCVMDGPYSSRGAAESIAWREAVPDAYVKSGC
ncbi:hypothetical protein [Notoacmeibacter marinus]|uniref:hypothetical protein n=1 Tax=Notoacmeibacter marinus TaxID=1876515 RepID=UPI000DF3BC01|nr:hypothetical protein [Notoacmeibacter marinus]